MTDHHPFIQGIAAQINGNIQTAIELADQRYRKKYHLIPTHISLPIGIDVEHGFNLGHHSGPGVVIVGRALDDRELA